MAYNFLRGDRDQPFLLPPDLRDWLPEGHLAWFVLDVVDQLDLNPFTEPTATTGTGIPPTTPRPCWACCCTATAWACAPPARSSDDASKTSRYGSWPPTRPPTTPASAPATSRPLASFLVESLKLRAAAGMVQVGTVALDGTKLAANAADKANRTHDKLEAEVAEILTQAAEADQREDRLFGDARGDELPEALASKADRLARLRQAKAQLEAEAAAREQAYQQRLAAHTAAATTKGTKPRQLKRRPQEAPNPKAVANATDPTAASCTPETAPSRATTPRPSPPWSR